MAKTTFQCGDVVALPMALSQQGFDYGKFAYVLRNGKAMIWCWHERDRSWHQRLVDVALLRDTFGQVQLDVPEPKSFAGGAA